MAKVVLAMFMSLDGYVAGPGGQFIPPQWSADVAEHWSGYNLEHAGHLLYGRANFEFNSAFWQSAATDPNSPLPLVEQAGRMNSFPKTVFSQTLGQEPGWNADLVSEDISAAVADLKASVVGDLYLFGGAKLAQSFVRSGLIDEYRIMVTPDLFGDGVRLFETGVDRKRLRLLEVRPLDTGAVIMHYRQQ